MTRPLLYGFLQNRVIIPYLKYLIVDIKRPGVRSRILAGLERIRVLKRTWMDVEILEKDSRTNGDRMVFEKYFLEGSPNLDALKADMQACFTGVQYQDTMLTYVLMDYPPSEQAQAAEIALGNPVRPLPSIKPWEELVSMWASQGKSIREYKENDCLSDQDDVNMLIASVIHRDVYKLSGAVFQTPAVFVEAFQTHLMNAVVFRPGMFLPPKRQQMQSLLLHALGDLPPLSTPTVAYNKIRTSIYLAQIEKTDPVLHYLVETLCTNKIYPNPISIDLFDQLYHKGVLDRLIKGCTYPIENVDVKVRKVNISPEIFRDTFRLHIEQCQLPGNQVADEVFRTRLVYKQLS
jgi:hypothetical protein